MFLFFFVVEGEFKYGLFACWESDNWITFWYVGFCSWCALADLSILIDDCFIDDKTILWYYIFQFSYKYFFIFIFDKFVLRFAAFVKFILRPRTQRQRFRTVCEI